MKVISDRGALLDAVNLVAAVVPSRTPTPQLSCVKLSATKGAEAGELTLSGTDAETSLHLTLAKVDVATPGDAVIPADKLRQIVQAEEGEPTLTLELDGDLCHIRGENAHFRVYGYPAGDFPPLPDFAASVAGTGNDVAKCVFKQDAGSLMSMVAKTVFATARETSRYAINGVLVRLDGKKLEMVATDGRRLAMARSTVAEVPKAEGDATTAIIPTKALQMIPKLPMERDDIVTVVLTDSRVYFAFGEPGDSGDTPPRAVLTSTLVEGTFPPYQEVIPKDQDKRILASRDELSRAVRQAAVLTNEESRGVRMAFSASDKTVRLSSRAPEMGEAEIDVSLSEYDGEDIEISFNPAFITDGLKALDDASVMIELKAANRPGLIRTAEGDFMYVIMPVTLPQ